MIEQGRSGILRISIHDDSGDARFKLEGKLIGECVKEAEKAWTAFAAAGAAQEAVVDLCGVSFVDGSGEEFLARVHAMGGKLVGSGPMINTLIEEIESKAPSAPN